MSGQRAFGCLGRRPMIVLTQKKLPDLSERVAIS
jgi:hypothetical protein